MRTKKFAMKCKRVLAVVLAFAMMLTTFVDASFVSKASTETLSYVGSIGEENDLFIDGQKFDELGMTFEDDTIIAILNSHTQKFDRINIMKPDKSTTVVSKDVWNAAVDKLSESEDRYLQFAFVDENNSYTMDWFFNKPIPTISDVVVKANVAFGNNVTVSFDNTHFPSERAGLNLNTDTQKVDYQAFLNALGNNEVNLEYVDTNGNVVDTGAVFHVNLWEDSINSSYHLMFGQIEQLDEGMTYTLQKRIYRGSIYGIEDGEWCSLNIDAMEAGLRNVGFTKQEILDILAYHAGEKFDNISIIQPYFRTEIYADVVNTALGMFKEDSGKNIDWYFNDWSGVNMQTRWGMESPQFMSADVSVSAQLGFNADGSPYVNVGSTAGLDADNLWVAYMVSKDENASVANALMNAMGTQDIRIEAAGSGATGDYSVDEWNVFIRLNEANKLTQGVNYTIKEKAYSGNVSYDRWDDGYEYVTLWIDAMDANKWQTGFTEQELLDILSTYGSGQFDQVRIKQPESQNVIYKSVAEAALSLFKDYDGKCLVWTFADFPGNSDFTWRLDAPYSMSGDQVVSTVIGFDGDGKPFVQMGDSSNINADQLGLEFGADRDMSAEGPKLVNVFGNQEMDIEAGNSGVEGHYNGCDNWINFNLWGVDRLDPNTGYTLGKGVYKGNAWYTDYGYSELEINYWDFDGTGVDCSDDAIYDILVARAAMGEKFDDIDITLPEEGAISAKVWNAALAILKNRDKENEWQDSSIWINFEDYSEYITNWVFSWPEAIPADAEVYPSAEVGFDQDGAYVKFGETDYPAENTFVRFQTIQGMDTYDQFNEIFDNDYVDVEYIDADGKVYGQGQYEKWDDGYGILLNMYSIADSMVSGVKYYVQEPQYSGDVNIWDDGRKVLEITYGAMLDNGMSFDDDTLLSILNKYTDTDFDFIYIYGPEGYTTYSAAVWNAAINLMTDAIRNDTWYVLQLAYGGPFSTLWDFDYPCETNRPVTLDMDTVWRTEGKGMSFKFPRTLYPAHSVDVAVIAGSETASFEMFEEAFGIGDNLRLEIVDERDNVIEYTNGKYEYSQYTDGADRYVYIYRVQELQSGQFYSMQKVTYSGYEWYDEELDYRQLRINYRGFDGTGVDCSDDAIYDILVARAATGEKFDHIDITLPEEGAISAKVWNAALAILKNRDKENEFQDSYIGINFEHTNYTGYITNWSFSWPEAIPADAEVYPSAEVGFDQDGTYVKFGETDYPAENTFVRFRTIQGMDTYDQFNEIFDNDYVDVDYIDADGKVCGEGQYEKWDDGYEIFLNMYSVVDSMVSGVKYHVQKRKYRGDIGSWKDEDGNVHQNLVIQSWGFGHGSHEPATVEEIISALQANAGKTFEEIYITQIYDGEGTVPASVINEAVKLFDPESWNHLDFGFQLYDDDSMVWSYSWAFEDIKGMENDLTASVEFSHDGDNVTMTIVGDYDTSGIDAQAVNLHYHTERDTETGTLIAAMLGENEKDLTLEGTDKNVYYEPHDDGELWLGFMDIADLEVNKTYKIISAAYRGDESYSDYADYSSLSIYWDKFAEYDMEYSEEAVLAILEDRVACGDKFNGISIHVPSKEAMTVSKEVWNIALQLLIPSYWGETEIAIDGDDGENYREIWSFINPRIANTDININSTVTFGAAGKGISMKFGRTEYPAERVDWNIHTNSPRIDLDKFETALGTNSVTLDIALNGNSTGVTAEYYTWSREGEVSACSVFIMGVNGLAKDKTYKTQKYVYSGHIDSWEDGTSYLHIVYDHAGYENEPIPVEEVVEILRRNKGKLFDQIYITQPASDNNVIPAKVINEALKYLKKQGEEIIKYAFVDPDKGAKVELQFQYVTAMTEDQENVTAYIGFDDNGVPYVNKGDLSNINAENIHLWYETLDMNEVDAIKEYFEFNRDISVEGTRASGWVEFQEDHAVIEVRDIGRELENDTNYTITNKVYMGEYYIWEDGRKELIIDEYGFEACGSVFSEENVLEILASYVGEEIDQVYLRFPADVVDVVSRDIWNAAVEVLKTFDPETGDMPQATFVFKDKEGFDEYWEMAAPYFVEEDVVLSVDYTVDGAVSFKFADTVFAAEVTSLRIQTNNGENSFEETLGWGEKDLQLIEEGKVTPVDAHVFFRGEEFEYFSEGMIYIDRIQNLTPNVTYNVVDYVYRGTVGYTEDGEPYSLYIDAFAFEKAKLTAADIAFVEYYAEHGITFEEITVLQKYEKTNVIKKELINALRPILNEEGEIWFDFLDENETYAIEWILKAPGEATKDINANVTLKGTANQGAKVEFNANTYNAESVRVMIGAILDSAFGAELVAGVEGAGLTDEQEDYADSLLVLKKGAEVDFSKDVYYERYNGDNNVFVTFQDVQNYESKVSYTLTQAYYIEPGRELFEVGVPYDWNERMVNDADGAVTWKSLSANVAEIAKDGTLTAVNPGMFVITGTYKMVGKLHTEVWIGLADIVLKSISFDKTEMEVFNDGASYELNVQTYPANAVVSPDALQWETSDEAVATVNADGIVEIKGVGTATITATVMETEISATCDIAVIEEVVIPEDSLAALRDLFAVTNFDVTLADIELPERFTWKVPTTKISDYAGLTGSYFEVVYTDERGFTVEERLWLPIMTISGMSLTAENFSLDDPYIARGESAVFGYTFDITNGDLEQLSTHEAFAELVFKPTGMVNVADSDQFVLETNEKTATGKKTVKLVAMYGKKTIATATAVVTVTTKTIEGFNGISTDPALDENDNIIPNTFAYTFWNPENYCKLTVTSSDSSVLKIGKIVYPTTAQIAAAKENGDPLTVLVPYTEGKAGSVVITDTLADEIKTVRKWVYTVVDSEPKVIETDFTINTSYDLKKAPITIQFANYFLPIEDLAIVNDTKGFRFEVAEYDQSAKKMTGYITLPEDTTLKAGTHTVILRAVVEQSGHGVKEYNIPIKVKVVTTKPTVTITQTRKVNTFYNQSEGGAWNFVEGYGILDISSKTDNITNISMVADDFELYESDFGYVIFYKPDDDGKDEKKVTICYDVVHPTYGTITGMEKVITIGTENKAPALDQNKKSETLYPGYDYTGVFAWNKATGLRVNLDSVSIVKSAKEVIELSTDGMNKTNVKVGKNNYAIYVEDGYIWIEALTRVQGADTLKFRIQDANWNKPIDISFKVDVKAAAPKVKLTSSKLTLNLDENVYRNEIAKTAITLPGYADALNNMEITFTGNDAKSKAVLNNQIKLSSDGTNIYAKFNFDPNTPVKQRPSGNYSFKVWITAEHFQTSTTVTVSVVNKPVSQNIKLTKSGSIDVLNRDGAYMLYIPKLSNMTGQVVGIELIGQDADNFTACFDEFNQEKIRVSAKESVELSTAVNYKIAFRLTIMTFDENGMYTYTCDTPVQTFKVTQGKSKVTLTSAKGTTLYTQAGNELKAQISAVLKDYDVAIESVTLANYAGDLDLIYDAETQTITFKRKIVDSYYVRIKEIAQNGKSWNVKLNVKFKDQAGNAKDTQVTYKMTIK